MRELRRIMEATHHVSSELDAVEKKGAIARHNLAVALHMARRIDADSDGLGWHERERVATLVHSIESAVKEIEDIFKGMSEVISYGR